MTTLTKGTGYFDLSNSDSFVGSLFSPKDIYEILGIDRISIDEFEKALKQLNLISSEGYVDEKDLYREYSTLKNLYSSQKKLTYTSLDEYILKRIIARAIPQAIITQQFEIKVDSASRAKKVDFKIDTPNKTVFIEFDGPSHYSSQFGQAHTSDERKKAIEDASGYECIIWPYWMQRCERNVKAIFNPDIKGVGALWSTNYFFGDFTIPEPSRVIIEETNRFNAINEDGFGYFYGANTNESRNIVPHSIIKKILKDPAKINLLIPKDWNGDKKYWLPVPLWELI